MGRKDESERKRIDKATRYAYRLFSIRPRSEKELKMRLYQKGYGRAITGEVISSLESKNILNDLQFAKNWVETRMRTKARGDILLRRELHEKGIAGPIIDQVLSEKKDDDGPVVRSLAEQRLEKLKGIPKEKARKRLFGFLARRGFDFNIIEEVLREVLR